MAISVRIITITTVLLLLYRYFSLVNKLILTIIIVSILTITITISIITTSNITTYYHYWLVVSTILKNISQWEG